MYWGHFLWPVAWCYNNLTKFVYHKTVIVSAPTFKESHKYDVEIFFEFLKEKDSVIHCFVTRDRSSQKEHIFATFATFFLLILYFI